MFFHTLRGGGCVGPWAREKRIHLSSQDVLRTTLRCNPARPLQVLESPGPSGPGIPKESQKSLPGLSALGSKKCPKQSRNTLRSLKIDHFDTLETVSSVFRTLFGPWGRKDSFETLLGFRARRARETPVRGGQGCKPCVFVRMLGGF